MILGCTIKYIDNDLLLRAILCSSKEMSDILQHAVLKQALLRSSQERLPQKRKILWLKLLKINEKEAKSEFILYKKLAAQNLTTSLVSSIQVDINRSFTTIAEIHSGNLASILFAYAVVNP
jgi:hypothetical protein